MAPARKHQRGTRAPERGPQGGARAGEVESWLNQHLSRFPRRNADTWTDYLYAPPAQQSEFERHLLDEDGDLWPFCVALTLKGQERALKPEYLDGPERGRARVANIVALDVAARSLAAPAGHRDPHALVAALCRPGLTEVPTFAIISASYHAYLTEDPSPQPVQGSGELQIVQRADLRPRLADYLDQVQEGQHLVVVDHDVACAHIEPGTLGENPGALVKTRTEVRRRFGAFMTAILDGAVAEVIDGRVNDEQMPAAVFRPPPRAANVRVVPQDNGPSLIALQNEALRERIVNLLNRTDGNERLFAAVDAATALAPEELQQAVASWRLQQPPPEIEELPSRQRQVAALLLKGWSEHEIVEHLQIPRTTVSGATRVIYRKFGVNSRGELRLKFSDPK